MNTKYITIPLKYILFILLLITFSFAASSESSVEEIIKKRKALFSKNYSTAKKVQAFASKGDFVKSKNLMIEMSENYKILLEYFPENTNEGFKGKLKTIGNIEFTYYKNTVNNRNSNIIGKFKTRIGNDKRIII